MSKQEKEVIAKAPSGRPTRQPVGFRSRLTVSNKDPNYVYRWVVDYDGTGDRLAVFKDAGYEICPSGVHRVGDNRVDVGNTQGSVETKKVGGGQTAYLMRQKKEWYDDDQKAKQAAVDEAEKALKQPSLEGFYGKTDIGFESK